MRLKRISERARKKEIKFVLCHCLPERSFHYKGRKFPLCARCTGGLIGYFTLPIFHFEIIRPSILLITLLMIPIAFDSTIQLLEIRESNNFSRFITGFLGGCAQAALIVLLGKSIINFLH
ncbi:MAG: DUF2085 domain-containing protein [Methanothermobacter sp.]|nr:DUF2085 domain-containing protein [Methanothermobacter sp.]